MHEALLRRETHKLGCRLGDRVGVWGLIGSKLQLQTSRYDDFSWVDVEDDLSLGFYLRYILEHGLYNYNRDIASNWIWLRRLVFKTCIHGILYFDLILRIRNFHLGPA